jgi:hypothetical protein
MKSINSVKSIKSIKSIKSFVRRLIAVVRFCEEISQTKRSVKEPPIFYKRARKKNTA